MTDARSSLIDALAHDIGAPALTPAEIESVLALAAVAAHGTGDRTSAPLAAFLAGVSAAGTGDRLAALDNLRRRAAAVAPSEQD